MTFALLVGCSSSSPGGAPGNPDAGVDAGPDVPTACSALAAAICTKFESCSPFGVSVDYGDVATCQTRFAMGCIASLNAPSTGATPAITMTCAQSFSQVSCTSFIAGDFGGSCPHPAGTIAGTGACGDDAQCQSTFCAISPTSQCGTCAPPTTVGGACANMACTRGMTCPSAGTTCVGPGMGQIGDACTKQEDCDLAHAVGCNTSSGKCFMLTLSSAGGMCGVASATPTSYAVCPASGSCSGIINGTCSAAVADGMACGTGMAGPSCMPPAKCVGGTCTLPNPSACH